MVVPVELIVGLMVFGLVESFNVDIDFPILKESTADNAYFGYSVAQHSPDENSAVYQQ